MFMNLLPKESVGSIFRVLLVVGCLTPSVANAGFDWTPPRAAPSQAAAPVVQDAAPAGPLTPEPDSLPVPVGNVESAPVAPTEPLVIENTKPAPTPTPAPVAEKVAEEPVMVEPAPAELPTPTPVATAPAAPAPAPVADDVIEGFGKDIPLAIALRDIAPPKYAYSFSPNDIAGTKISWRGGKPWQDVLKDAIAPHGLNMSITENAIVIFAQQANMSAAPAASAPAPTLVATQPDEATAEPLPLVGSEQAQSQEAAIKPAPTEIRRTATTAMNMKATRQWQARPGTTLRQTLETWSKESNVELNWSTPYDYPINNAFYFDGEFTQAVDSLLSSYGGENPSPKGRLYPNLPEGPSVLMVN